jgi:hypothetical protein
MVMGRNTNMSCQHTPPCEGIFVYGGTEGISLVMYSFFSSLPWWQLRLCWHTGEYQAEENYFNFIHVGFASSNWWIRSLIDVDGGH